MLARAHVSSARLRPVERAVQLAARGKHLVLAVSGGRDSMALMHAFARVAPGAVSMVATFDHGTGRAASRAAALAANDAIALGFPVVIGSAPKKASTEAAWRQMRLQFLDDVARSTGAIVATAHTQDDQVETVFMRILRGTGPRGLAGLYAAGSAVRPFLEVSRDDVAAFAAAAGVRWIDDPSNASPRHLRNRVRRDLLPAIARAHPGFEQDLLRIARRAAQWRGVVDAWVTELMPVDARLGGLSVSARALTNLTAGELALVWPSIAARAGARTDWRGTDRLVAFTREGRVGARISLSGGWDVARTRDAFELRRGAPRPNDQTRPLSDGLIVDAWTFRATGRLGEDAWTASLPPGVVLAVRPWRPGDRMRSGPGQPPRRVKRYLTDAHIGGTLRARWPVVLAGKEIVWIPGVRRGGAAAERPGRPGVPYRCELNDR